MKKVAILTFTYGDNYGQRLQNLALQTVLSEMGCEVCTIRQISPKVGYKRKIKELIKALIGKSEYLKILRRHFGFWLFDNQYITFYKKKIGEEQIPKGLSEEFDFFVCGSDQIWSPFSTDVNETFFLTFAERKKRISYAVSLAAEYIPEEKKELYIRRLGNFDRISIREEKLADWIMENVGISPEIHLDPTLLLNVERWEKIAKKPRAMCKKEYVLCYLLGKQDRIQHYIEKYGLERLQIINLMDDEKYYYTKPDEFLYWIRKAKIVITDSYHGTIFSILFKTPFIVITRDGCEIDMSSRFTTLLKMLGIKEQVIRNKNGDLFFESMDYRDVEEKIREVKQHGIEYLEKCLFNEKREL